MNTKIIDPVAMVRAVPIDDLVRAGLGEDPVVTMEELAEDGSLDSLRAAHERARDVIIRSLLSKADPMRRSLPLTEAEAHAWGTRIIGDGSVGIRALSVFVADALRALERGEIPTAVRPTGPDALSPTEDGPRVLAAVVLAVSLYGDVLLVEESRGWGLPGGMTEPEETPVAAALRELQEETGLDGSEWTMVRRTIVGGVAVYEYEAAIGHPCPGPGILRAAWTPAKVVLNLHEQGKLAKLPSLERLLAWAKEKASGSVGR